MNTQTKVTLLLVMLLSSLVVAQQPSKSQMIRSGNQVPKTQTQGINLQAASSGGYTENTLPGTKGSAYLNPEFVEGLIIFKDGNRVEGSPMRYNLYTQQMQMINNGDTVAIGNPAEIEYIRIADRVFVYTDYLCNSEHKTGYFELLENGNCRLLKRWSALYYEVDQTENGGLEANCFFRDCHCFIQFYLNPAASVQPKKKDFVQSFASNGNDVKEFMKQNNLKPKNVEDLKKVVDFYNSLR